MRRPGFPGDARLLSRTVSPTGFLPRGAGETRGSRGPPRLLLRSPGRASGTLTVVQAASVPNLHLPEVIASEADGVPLRSAQTCFLL